MTLTKYRSFLLSLTGAVTLTAPAFAAGIEDRDNDAQSSHHWAYNISIAQFQSIIAQGYRSVDIEIVRTSPSLLLTMTYVKNTGSFKKGWHYAFGKTSGEIINLINQNQARLTDIEAYEVNGTTRFAALMETNSPNGKGWWWRWDKTSAELLNTASSFGARIVDLERYEINGQTRYAAIMLKNSGQEYKPWYYGFGRTMAQLNTIMANNNAQIWDLDYRGNGIYDAIMVKKSQGDSQWRLFGLTKSQVTERANQYGARIIDIEQYNTLANPRFNVVMTNALGPVSKRIRNEMQAKSNGWTGFYAKRLDVRQSDSQIAALNRDRVFEPAATLMTLHHAHAMRVVSTTNLNSASLLTINTNTVGNNSCPQATLPYKRNLGQVLSGMMEQTNYSYARAITDRFGVNNLNTTASGLGMSATKINHTIGCGSPANTTRLSDLARLHEAIDDGYLGSAREEFYSRMTNSFATLNIGYASGRFRTILDQEAAKVGLSNQQKTDFIAEMEVAGKHGYYTVNGKYHRSFFAYVSVPFWRNGGIHHAEYAAGAFVNDGNNSANAAEAARIGATEVLREQIHAAMESLKTYAFGRFTSFGTSCAGNLTPWIQTASGTPELGQTAIYRATTNRAVFRKGIFFIGSSKTSWNNTPLPLHLSVIGASGCFFRTNALLAIPVWGVNGHAKVEAQIPIDTSLVGLTAYSQFLFQENGANALNVLATNAIGTKIGGQK